MLGRPHGQWDTVRNHSAIRFPHFILLGSLTILLPNAHAEIRVLTAQDEHIGDRDTYKDAVRVATESAKRNALEQAPPVRTHAEHSFNQLNQHSDQGAGHAGRAMLLRVDEQNGHYDSDQYWIGKGQGDLTKGRVVCQRVSELSARTDLAKQIRVLVKEHMVDRVRERSGRDAEQDIELTREEIVQEYLLGVKIVDRQIDEEQKICTATAVMLKTPMHPKQPPDHDTTPAASR